MRKPPQTELLRDLLARFNEAKRFEGYYELPPRPGSLPRPYDVPVALGVGRDALSNTAAAALAAIEEMSGEDDSSWTDFRWKLTAFVYVQDIFDAVVHPSEDPLVWFHQYYFYYESRRLLAESVLAGLNGLYAASGALLRPFLEFSLLQNYYYRVCREVGSYSPLEQYFAERKHPSWNTILTRAIPDEPFCRVIRFRLQSNLAGLSESSLHPYHPDFSPLQHRHSEHGHSLAGIFFWHSTMLVLESALWCYYVNFPLLFHPVDVLRKFGFNGPAGVVIEEQCAEAVKRSLSAEDYTAFHSYSLGQDSTKSVLEWANAQRDLTDDEVEKTWDEREDGKFPGLVPGYCCRMSKLRALRAAMSLPVGRLKGPPDEMLREVHTLSGWRRLSRRPRGHRR